MQESVTIRLDTDVEGGCDGCNDQGLHIDEQPRDLFLIAKWDTEAKEYYASQYLCPTHLEEHNNPMVEIMHLYCSGCNKEMFPSSLGVWDAKLNSVTCADCLRKQGGSLL